MAKQFNYTILFVMILAGCNNSQSAKITNSGSINEIKVDSREITNLTKESATEYVDDELEDDTKSIEEILQVNQAALELAKSIKSVVESKKQIKNFEELEKVLEQRDSLVNLLNKDEEFENQMLGIEDIWSYFEAFEKIGISIITVEGIYISLDKAPLLVDLVEKYADEPFKLKTKIENTFGSMRGGEYPFTDLKKELELIPLAEKMLTQYPGYKHNKEVAKMLDQALFPLVDFHTVGCDDSFSYIVGNYSVDEFPGRTDINYHKQFIKEAKNSRFAKVVEKVFVTPSNMCTWGDTLYYVAVPDLKPGTKVFANEKLNQQLKNLPTEFEDMNDSFKYLWLGVDVPHYLTFSDNGVYTNTVAYRFFGSKELALKSLANIKKVIPKAKLVEHLFSEDEKWYELGAHE